MKPFTINGIDILHEHLWNRVVFSAWKGNNKLNHKSIQKDRREVDWKKPLTESEISWLCSKEEA